MKNHAQTAILLHIMRFTNERTGGPTPPFLVMQEEVCLSGSNLR